MMIINTALNNTKNMSDDSVQYGAAINNDGKLTLKYCLFQNNTTAIASAIYNDGYLYMYQGKLVDNQLKAEVSINYQENFGNG